jgi:hypothetical protein
MEPVAHRRRAIRDQIVDREVRRLEILQRARRKIAAPPSRPHDAKDDSPPR